MDLTARYQPPAASIAAEAAALGALSSGVSGVGVNGSVEKKKRKRSNRKEKGLEAFRSALLQHLTDNARLSPAPPQSGGNPSTPNNTTPNQIVTQHGTPATPGEAAEAGSKHDADSVTNHAANSLASTPSHHPAGHAAANTSSPAGTLQPPPQQVAPQVTEAQRQAWLREYAARISNFSIKQLVKESVRFRFPCDPYVILVPNWHALREALWAYLKTIGVKKAKRSVSTKKDLIDICIQDNVKFDFSEFVKDAESHGNRKEREGATEGSDEKPKRKKIKRENGTKAESDQEDEEDEMDEEAEENSSNSIHPIQPSPANSAAAMKHLNQSGGASRTTAHQSITKTEPFLTSPSPSAPSISHSQHHILQSPSPLVPSSNGMTCQDVIHHFLNLSPHEYQNFKNWFYVNVVQRENPGLNITITQSPANSHAPSTGGHQQQSVHNPSSTPHHAFQSSPSPAMHHQPTSSSQLPTQSHQTPLHHSHGLMHSLPPTPMLSSALPPLTPSLNPETSANQAQQAAFQQWTNNVIMTPVMQPSSTPQLQPHTHLVSSSPLNQSSNPLGLFSPPLGSQDPTSNAAAASAAALAAAQQALQAMSERSALQQQLLAQQQQLEKLQDKTRAMTAAASKRRGSNSKLKLDEEDEDEDGDDEDDDTDDDSDDDDGLDVKKPSALASSSNPVHIMLPATQLLATPITSPLMPPPPAGPSPLTKRTVLNLSNFPSASPSAHSPSLRALYRATGVGTSSAAATSSGMAALSQASPLLSSQMSPKTALGAMPDPTSIAADLLRSPLPPLTPSISVPPSPARPVPTSSIMQRFAANAAATTNVPVTQPLHP